VIRRPTTLITLLLSAAGLGLLMADIWHKRRQISLRLRPRGVTEAGGVTRKRAMRLARLDSVPEWPTAAIRPG